MQSSKDAVWTPGLTLKQAVLVAGFTCLLNPVTFAEAYVMPRLISADPAETVKIFAAELIFTIWLLGWGWCLKKPESLIEELR